MLDFQQELLEMQQQRRTNNMRNKNMKYLMIMFSILFCSSLTFAKPVTGKKNQLKALHSQCMSTGAYDKMVKICGCIHKEISKKMTAKQIDHIYLVRQGRRNESKLPVDEGAIAEDFEADVSAQCMGRTAH